MIARRIGHCTCTLLENEVRSVQALKGCLKCNATWFRKKNRWWSGGSDKFPACRLPFPRRRSQHFGQWGAHWKGGPMVLLRLILIYQPLPYLIWDDYSLNGQEMDKSFYELLAGATAKSKAHQCQWNHFSFASFHLLSSDRLRTLT